MAHVAWDEGEGRRVARFGLGRQRALLSAPALAWALAVLPGAALALANGQAPFDVVGLCVMAATGVVCGLLLWRARAYRGDIVVDAAQGFIEAPAGLPGGDAARRAAVSTPAQRTRIPFAAIRDVRESTWFIGRGSAAAPRYTIHVRDDFGALRFSLDAADRIAFFLLLGASPADPAPLARAWRKL